MTTTPTGTLSPDSTGRSAGALHPVTDVHATDVHATETDVHATDVHATDVHATDVHATDVHATDVHATDVPITEVHGIYRLAAVAATAALAALMVGGAGMALTSRPGTATTDILAAIAANSWPFVAAGVGLTLVSLFDIFTIPALHLALGGYGRVLVTVASVTAIIGDLLGIVGRLAQTAMVPLGLQTGAPDAAGSIGRLGAAQVLDVLDTTVNTAGFVLVSVSFTCFGLLMLRGFSRPLGWVAIVAGLFTLLGQIPPLAPVFLVANVAYIAWYVGVARRFWRATQHP